MDQGLGSAYGRLVPHELERYFGLSADRLFDVIRANPRCLMNVKGAVAEEHLRLEIEGLKAQGVVDSYTIGGEGKPDFTLEHDGRRTVVECKDVEKAKNKANREALVSVTIDFKKTRNQLQGKHLRFYHRTEFDIVAACLFNRTGEWRFVFAPTSSFAEHPDHPGLGHLSDKLVVMREGRLLPNWNGNLETLLRAR